jgi:thiamine biosynthesis lipoprotein
VKASARWDALGTSAEVFVTDERELERARRIVEGELEAVELACSRSRDQSELARVNAEPGRWVEVSPLFLEAVHVALAAARATEGDVDPTIGRALRVAGYDLDFAELPAVRTGRVTFAPAPGWRLVQVDPSRPAVRVPRGVELDFGATAKALAADRASAACATSLQGGVLVNVGGDLAVGGPPPDGGWAVRVTDDYAAGFEAPGQTIAISDGGLATSSVALAGTAAANERWRTVSVAAANCVAANVASAAAIVRGASAPSWLDSLRLPARLVGADGSVARVANWPAAA